MKLDIKNITKDFNGFKALNKVSFEINEGIIGLLGANGAGKTTLMKILCTLSKPSDGTILFNDANIFELGENYRDLLGYLPQDFGYYPDYTAIDFLHYIAVLKDIDQKTIKQKCHDVLKLVDLDDVGKKKIHEFSGGMIRRLGIAQAIINNPKILILDEPSAGLDIKERAKLRNILSKLALDRIILISTHIVSDITYTANNIIVLKKGEIIANGKVDEIISELNDCVWEMMISPNEVDFVSKKYCVSNMKNVDHKICIRVISNKMPSESAIQVLPTLEDFYLYKFGEEIENE